jgi:hypothetical protein
MYGYFTTFILIFLTSPGVMYTLMEPGIFGGVVHAVTVLILQSASEGRPSAAATVEIIYWIAFGLWAYIKARMALAGAATGAIRR